MHGIRGDDIQSLGEEEGAAADTTGRIDLLVRGKKGLHIKGIKSAVQTFLAISVDKNGHKGDGGEDQRPVSPVREFGEGRDKVDQIDTGDEDHQRHFPLIGFDEDQNHHDRGNRHRTGDRHTVGGSKILRLLEKEHDKDDGTHQHPVHSADINLRLNVSRGVIDLHQRHQAGGNPLIDNGKDPADDRLRSDDRRADG